MSGHTVIYQCLCSDAAGRLEDMPDRCPGHDQPRTGHHANDRPGGLRHGHDCPVNVCTTQPTRPHPRATDHDREDDDA